MLKYCEETVSALIIFSAGKRTTGSKDVTERGIASLIQRVAIVKRRKRMYP